MLLVIAVISVLALAYANGANDNFKGVATLFGSGVADYRRVLAWATVCTLAGSAAAIGLSAHLVETFSGKLFVSAQTLALPAYPLAVCAAAAATVLLATGIGAPISTTHALAGALLGAAFAAPESAVNWGKALTGIFLPLGVGPLVALAAALLLYPALRYARARLGIGRENCVCVGQEWVPVAIGSAALRATLASGTTQQCRTRYQGQLLGVSAGGALDTLHYLSAGAVSFARGLNDTPKIVALTLLCAPALGLQAAFVTVGLAIALGGWLSARRVAETMAHKITALSPGQGYTANLVTAALVLAASPLGLPLSTTHVSCGALFGIGAVTGQARWKTIGTIVGAWLVTLPLAAALGAFFLRAALPLT